MSKYKGTIREYTVVGISAVFKKLVSQDFIDFFNGEKLESIIAVVREGNFYHFQMEEKIPLLSKAFLQRINDQDLDLELLYKQFDLEVSKLEAIYKISSDEYNLELLQDFYPVYANFVKYLYAVSYSPDFLNEIIKDKDLALSSMQWITKMRLRGETIYKFGEMEFLPKYLAWLAEKHLTDYTAEELQYLTCDELLNYLKGKSHIPPKAVLHDRKNFFYLRFTEFEQIEHYQGEEAEFITKEQNLFQEIDASVEDIKEFQGQIGFSGVVKGKVRLISKRADMVNFQDDEIIVSPMTDPSYLPIMKRSSAFITDEGGMLCHAAIVARELKKPCIIGTKIATKILKDGDLVEVDANNGIIKIFQ